MLEVREVRKTFGRFQALNDINLKIDEGSFVGLIGPNGSGKTTFFNVLSGVYTATSGDILLEGRNITKWTPDKICHAGIVRTFQIPRPIKEMSILENVMVGVLFGKDGVKISDAEARRQSVEWLKFVGLQLDPETLPDKLTAGNLRRLELARSLATRPRLLLADEIMSGLNPNEIEETSEVLRKIRNELHITIVWVEHIMGALMNLVEYVVVLENGEIIARGTPREIATNQRVIEAYLGTEEDED